MYIRESGDGLKNIKQAIAFMKSNKVYVGIPEKNSDRGGKMTNVQLAYIHSNGSPKMHIPPRPFLEPGVEDAREAIAEEMGEAALAASEGDFGAAMAHLDGAGQEGENGVKLRFGTGAANAPITVHGGWMMNPVSHKPFHVKGKGSSAPLIDTGALRQSVTHVIESK